MANTRAHRSIVVTAALAQALLGSACSKTPPSEPPPSCDNVGCGAPPLCAVGCQGACGCCPCTPGEQSGDLICTSAGCYAQSPVADGGLKDGGPAATDAAADGGWVPPAACALPFDVGPCDAAIPVYAYVNGACVPRTYGGCQGNDNRFRTLEECLAACEGRPIPNGCPSGRIAQEVCLACGAGGGCATRGVVCALPCDAAATCTSSSLFCQQGVCQVGGCI